tara:strand:- start:1295 stop:2089 length:795 start_codon:yes stop_codon:yes gene_type:complete
MSKKKISLVSRRRDINSYKKSLVINKNPEPSILIATPIWRRPDIFKIFVKNNKKYGDILAVGSEGARSRALAEKLGCKYIESPNKPLGKKLNCRSRYFLENKKYTHMILLGSDDIISENIFNAIKLNCNKYDLISWSDLYFYDINKDTGYYCSGYKNHRSGEPMAPGRCLSRRLVKKMGPDLWPNNLAIHPDGPLWRNKLSRESRATVLSCKKVGGYIVDIKSDTNISTLDDMKRTTSLEALSTKERSYIRKMIGLDKSAGKGA